MYKNLSMQALGHSVPFDQACALARKHGFAGVELDLRFLRSLGSQQTALDWFGAFQLHPGGFSLNAAWRECDTEDSFDGSLETVVGDAKLAAALGCKRCHTWVLPRSDKLDFYQHFDLVVPRLIRVADVLANHGIMLGFEFIGPSTMRTGPCKDFVHSLDGMRTFAAAIGMHSLNTGVLLDSFHWFASGGTLAEIEHLDQNEVVSVHVNDAVVGRGVEEQLDQEREMVGSTGLINIAGFLAALRTIGYVGPLTVEPFNARIRTMSPDSAAATASAALDRVLA